MALVAKKKKTKKPIVVLKWMIFSLRKTKTKKRMVEASSLKVEIIRVLKMKTTPTNSTLLQMISTSSWKTVSKPWKSRKCLDWILES